jgi:hypothetical protein
MKCSLRGNIECSKLKFKRDELFCSSVNKYLQDMSQNECNGDDEFTQSLGCKCPACGREISLGQNLCTNCGFDLDDLK